MDSTKAYLSIQGRYTKFCYGNRTITFLHGKDLIHYLSIKEWDKGYIVVTCLGRKKGEYEDYIDLSDIMSNLYMDPDQQLSRVKEVVIKNE